MLVFAGCNDWLERKPQNVILEEQVWNDPKMITGLLANYYDRLPAHTSLTTGWAEFSAYESAAPGRVASRPTATATVPVQTTR